MDLMEETSRPLGGYRVPFCLPEMRSRMASNSTTAWRSLGRFSAFLARISVSKIQDLAIRAAEIDGYRVPGNLLVAADPGDLREYIELPQVGEEV